MIARSIVFALGVTGLAAAAGAHHSIAGMYDRSREVRLEGVVRAFEFVNPHPFVTLEVTEAGLAGEWQLEMDNRREMTSIGIDAGTLRPGDRLVVRGSPARREPRRLYISSLERPADGFAYEQVGSRPRMRVPES